MDEKIQYEVRVLMEKLKQSSSQSIFLHNVFDISVLNVLWTMITGERYDLDDERLMKLLKIIHDAFKIVDASGGMLNQLPFLRFIAPEFCGYNTIVEILTSMWDFLKVEKKTQFIKETLQSVYRRQSMNTRRQSAHLHAI